MKWSAFLRSLPRDMRRIAEADRLKYASAEMTEFPASCAACGVLELMGFSEGEAIDYAVLVDDPPGTPPAPVAMDGPAGGGGGETSKG